MVMVRHRAGSLLAAAERVDEDGEFLDGRVPKARGPGRHDAMFWSCYLSDDGVFTPALQPDGIGKIRCAHLRLAPGILAVTGRTIVQEYLLAGFH